ncbi:helix-turn-helix domain-containing protein [Corynebacterium mastitidis]|uniref:Helix-turn-helix domain-containing protein n=1 Tax=Corynebacterium mastitidis TaxID=161890 RepID=A0ABU8NVL3_9CORY
MPLTENIGTAREALRQLTHALDAEPQPSTVNVAIEHSDEAIRIPRDVALTLREVLVNAVAHRAVSVVPTQAELTTQQAADLLNVSRPYVVKLMDEGILPGHKVGTHRRIYASDLQEYRHQRDIAGRAAADELTALTEKLGLYE